MSNWTKVLLGFFSSLAPTMALAPLSMTAIWYLTWNTRDVLDLVQKMGQ